MEVSKVPSLACQRLPDTDTVRMFVRVRGVLTMTCPREIQAADYELVAISQGTSFEEIRYLGNAEVKCLYTK